MSSASAGCSTPTTTSAGGPVSSPSQSASSTGRRSTTSTSRADSSGPRLRLSATTTSCAGISLSLDDVTEDGDGRRTDHDDEQCGQDAEDQREEDLHRHLLRLLLGPLRTFDPHVGRL